MSNVKDHPLYRTWRMMIRRCTSEKCAAWPRYGGRGITVCRRWLDDFRAFVSDVGDRPVGTSLDRIDNDRGYEPSNVRWATREQQSANSINTKWIEFNGERMPTRAWARRLGITHACLKRRLRRWPIETTLTTPALSAGHHIDAHLGSHP